MEMCLSSDDESWSCMEKSSSVLTSFNCERNFIKIESEIYTSIYSKTWPMKNKKEVKFDRTEVHML